MQARNAATWIRRRLSRSSVGVGRALLIAERVEQVAEAAWQARILPRLLALAERIEDAAKAAWQARILPRLLALAERANQPAERADQAAGQARILASPRLARILPRLLARVLPRLLAKHTVGQVRRDRGQY